MLPLLALVGSCVETGMLKPKGHSSNAPGAIIVAARQRFSTKQAQMVVSNHVPARQRQVGPQFSPDLGVELVVQIVFLLGVAKGYKRRDECNHNTQDPDKPENDLTHILDIKEKRLHR